jgi:hypothetical protein
MHADGFQTRELQRWKRDYNLFLRKITWRARRKPLLKNPANTGRISLLKQMYPRANPRVFGQGVSDVTSDLFLKHEATTARIHQTGHSPEAEHATAGHVGDDRPSTGRKQMMGTDRRSRQTFDDHWIRLALDLFAACDDQTLDIDAVPPEQLVEVSCSHATRRLFDRPAVGAQSAQKLRHRALGAFAIHRHSDPFMARGR